MALELTKAELQQLLSYLNARDKGPDAGWYYSPKKQFEMRHARLKNKLEVELMGDTSTMRMGPLTECDMHEDESY